MLTFAAYKQHLRQAVCILKIWYSPSALGRVGFYFALPATVGNGLLSFSTRAIVLRASPRSMSCLPHVGLSLLLGCLAASFREPIPCVGGAS